MNLIQSFRKDEAEMNSEISSRTSSVEFVDFDERVYKVESTGATISGATSISLLHGYCSKLPHDEFFKPKPRFYFFDDTEGTVCNIILPANAPIHQIMSSPQPSTDEAKKDACLKACQELHQVGALSDYLLPDDGSDEVVEDSSDSDSDDEESSRRELHEMRVPSSLCEPWAEVKSSLNSYFIKFTPMPPDRLYKEFGLFVKASIPEEAARMTLELQLARGRSVSAEIVPYGVSEFVENQIVLAERFQEMWLKAIIDKLEFISHFVQLGKDDGYNSISSTFYLLLPVIVDEYRGSMSVDWKLITKCLSSPIFKNPEDITDVPTPHTQNCLNLANGPTKIDNVLNSLVYVPCKDVFFFVSELLPTKDAFSVWKETTNYVTHFAEAFKINLLYPDQPLLKAKQVFRLDNLLRKRGNAETRDKEEHFVELPPEVCVLKIIGFSKEIGSSLSLVPSIIHRLESFLVAIELKHMLSASFPEGAEVSAQRILEALTTERCNERFSLERLEILGDAFLKFTVGRHLFLSNAALDEGQLTRKRSNMVNNSHLFKLALLNNLHVYVRDQPFEPSQFYPLGRRCPVLCTEEMKFSIHSTPESNLMTGASIEVRCSKGHHWLQKKTIADVVEALVGAFIVDSGFKAAAAFLRWIGIRVDYNDMQVTRICASSTIFTPLSTQIDIPALENLLGYEFRHKGLLLQAILHPSYHNNYGGCYQRLEFLGDAVLDYLITSYLYTVYPNLKPGHLTDLRSFSVNNTSFAGIAVNRSFYKFMLCDSSSLIQTMNKYANFIKTLAPENVSIETVPCPKALGDLVESCVGAILLDSGFDLNLVWKVMLSFLDPVMKFSALQLNPIRELQELCQFYNWELTFPSVRKDRLFTVEAIVDGEEVSERASASNFNKKAAKRTASKSLHQTLKDKGYKIKMKSLGEILKLSQKMEAQLVGYDEIPTVIDVSCVDLIEDLKSNGPLRNVSAHQVQSGAIKSLENGSCIRRLTQSTPQCSSSAKAGSSVTSENSVCNGNSETPSGGLRKSSAKSHLHEICAVNCWEPPVFECCEERGPPHLREYVFKVSVKFEASSSCILDCVGEVRPKKKEAAESAAQGIICYLKNIGFLS